MCEEIVRVPLPSTYGSGLSLALFRGDNGEEVPVIIRPPEPGTLPYVRVHSSCFTGDVLASLRCDCGPQLSWAIERVSESGGAVIYLHQEGRGIGLEAKLRAYALQDTGLDTVDANIHQGLAVDARSYALAAHVLQQLGWLEILLLSNNPDKRKQLSDHGLKIHHAKTPTFSNVHNTAYLETKRERMNHLLDLA